MKYQSLYEMWFLINFQTSGIHVYAFPFKDSNEFFKFLARDTWDLESIFSFII